MFGRTLSAFPTFECKILANTLKSDPPLLLVNYVEFRTFEYLHLCLNWNISESLHYFYVAVHLMFSHCNLIPSELSILADTLICKTLFCTAKTSMCNKMVRVQSKTVGKYHVPCKPRVVSGNPLNLHFCRARADSSINKFQKV